MRARRNEGAVPSMSQSVEFRSTKYKSEHDGRRPLVQDAGSGRTGGAQLDGRAVRAARARGAPQTALACAQAQCECLMEGHAAAHRLSSQLRHLLTAAQERCKVIDALRGDDS